MVLGDVEETHTVVEVDEETFEEIIKVRAEFIFAPRFCALPFADPHAPCATSDSLILSL